MYRCRFKAKSDHAKYEKSKCLFLFSFYRFHNFAIVSLVGYFLATHFGESDFKFVWFIVKICCFVLLYFCCENSYRWKSCFYHIAFGFSLVLECERVPWRITIHSYNSIDIPIYFLIGRHSQLHQLQAVALVVNQTINHHIYLHGATTNYRLVQVQMRAKDQMKIYYCK